MIQRYQRILLLILLGSSAVMLGFLIYLHQHAYKVPPEETPIEAPSYTPAENVSLDLADDANGSITPTIVSIALPSQPAIRVRALLEHLLSQYTLPQSAHPVGGGVAIESIYLLDLPLAGPGGQRKETSAAARTCSDPLTCDTGELAVVNLRGSWADAHPSGITVETLTIQSILGTIHANLPEITKVKFLVDGQPRDTLAGNVELNRIYDVVDTATEGADQQ